jgi:hypothetical protein
MEKLANKFAYLDEEKDSTDNKDESKNQRLKFFVNRS